MSAETPLKLVAVDERQVRPARVDVLPADEERRGGAVFVVDFHGKGNSVPYRMGGWSGQEDTHVWTLGASSTMRLPSMLEATPLVVDIDIDICRMGSLLTSAVVRVFANDVAIGKARAAGRSRFRCVIPQEIMRAGDPIELRFEHPCYARMDWMDFGQDDRVLGLCFYSVAVYPPWLSDAATRLLPQPEGQQLLEPLPAIDPHGEPSERAVYRFAASVAERLPLESGWRFDEAGNAWADARECYVNVPAPQRPGRYFARFDIVPLFVRTILVAQRISIVLNGAVLGQFRTGCDTLLSVPLPPELIEWGGTLEFGFIVPDGTPMHEWDSTQERHFLSFILDAIAIEPIPSAQAALGGLRCDDLAPPAPTAVSERFLDESIDDLAMAVKEELGVEVAHILRQFESLGDNCALGLAQRKAEAEVLGLLRFANSPLKKLMGGVEDEFRALDNPSTLDMRWQPSDPGEFVLYSKDYGLRWHTNLFDASAEQTALFAQQSVRLSYLRRKFLEGLKAGRKIYAISRAEPLKHPIPMPDADELPYHEEKPEPLRFAELLPLFLELNRHGANTLLYLVPTEHGRRGGSVELIAPGVMRGFLDDFAITPDPKIKDHAAWLRVAVNAWLLDRGANVSFRQRAP